jgi:hypothetical protein
MGFFPKLTRMEKAALVFFVIVEVINVWLMLKLRF